ncbi:MAG: octaprenyl-diphosphate synthase [Desulfovibrionales bacterium]|jgi:octaprenyl-diphosphate synthase|nr:octaprenyl-diphosphate synthase [Desulfovibrionales bacterium]
MKELREYFDRELPRIDSFLQGEVQKLHGLVRQVAEHVIMSPGKRIRPMLTLLFARSLGPLSTDPYPLACALEMLHSATLLHDDVLDGAETRRGQASAHITFGATQAILAGDVLLALSNRIGADYGIPEISRRLSGGAMATAMGEIQEMAAAGSGVIDRKEYLEIIIGKTAKLIETACRLGAVLSGADQERIQAAADYGLNVGMSFQLVDDLLDYSGDAERLGKPSGSDLVEGKITLPLIDWLETIPPAERQEILTDIAEKRLAEPTQRRIIEGVRKAGADGSTQKLAEGHVRQALDALDAFPDSEEREVLIQAASFILTRQT